MAAGTSTACDEGFNNPIREAGPADLPPKEVQLYSRGGTGVPVVDLLPTSAADVVIHPINFPFIRNPQDKRCSKS